MDTHSPTATQRGARVVVVGKGADPSSFALSPHHDTLVFLDWSDYVFFETSASTERSIYLELDAERRTIEKRALQWAQAAAPVASHAAGHSGEYAERVALVTRRILQHGLGFAAAASETAARAVLAHVTDGARIELADVDALTAAFIAHEARARGISVGGMPPADRAELLPGIERPLLRALASAVRHAARGRRRAAAASDVRDLRRRADRIIMFVSQAPRDEVIAGSSVALLRDRGAAVVKVDLSRDGRMLESGYAADLLVDGRLWAHAYPLDLLGSYLRRRKVAVARVRASLPTELQPIADRFCATAVAHAALTAPAVMRSCGRLLDAVAPERIVVLGETNRVVEPLAHEARARGVPITCVQHGIIHDIPQWSEMPFSTFAVFGSAYAEVLNSMGTPAEHVSVTGDPRLDRAVHRDPRPRDRVLEEVLGDSEASRDKHLITYATNYMSHRLSGASMERAFRALIYGMQGLDDALLLIKLHPQGAGRELPYERVLAEDHGVPYAVAPRDSNLVDLIAVSDAVVVHVSSVGFEAAAMHKPLVVMNTDDGLQEIPFTREGVGYEAKSARSVASLLPNILSGELGAAPLDMLAAFNQRYNHLLDGRATARLADAIEASRW